MKNRGKELLLQQAREKLTSGNGKILIIQTAFLGDVILLTPLLRAIRNSFPKSKVTTVVVPECANVLNGQVDEIITFDKRDRGDLKSRWQKLISDLKMKKFDVALIPHRSFRSAVTAYRARIPVRIGFKRGMGSYLHTNTVNYPESLYEGLRNLRLLNLLKEIRDSGIPELHPRKSDLDEVDNYIHNLKLKEGSFVILAPGSVWKSKRWLVESYRELAEQLEKNFRLSVVTIGGPGDKDVCAKVVQNPECNLAGKLSPLGSAALISKSRFMVSGDTAPAHLGTAMGTKQIIIYGSTSPKFGFAPPVDDAKIAQVSIWCRPCSNHGRNFCPNLGIYHCLKKVTPDMILSLAKDWLK